MFDLKLNNYEYNNFEPLEYRDPQLKVGKKLNYIIER